MARFPVQFELPTVYGSTEPAAPYIPPRSHDAEEAGRRRQAPPGTLVLEQQRIGALTARLFIDTMLRNTPDDEAIQFGSRIVSSAAFGSALYSFASVQKPEEGVMRRHIPLPRLVGSEPDERMSLDDQRTQVLRSLVRTEDHAGKLWAESAQLGRVSPQAEQTFGRAAAASALWVALLPHPEVGEEDSNRQVQQRVRAIGLRALTSASQLSTEIGMRVSLAMLGGSTTRLSAYIEERAPDSAYGAFVASQDAARGILS